MGVVDSMGFGENSIAPRNCTAATLHTFGAKVGDASSAVAMKDDNGDSNVVVSHTGFQPPKIRPFLQLVTLPVAIGPPWNDWRTPLHPKLLSSRFNFSPAIYSAPCLGTLNLCSFTVANVDKTQAINQFCWTQRETTKFLLHKSATHTASLLSRKPTGRYKRAKGCLFRIAAATINLFEILSEAVLRNMAYERGLLSWSLMFSVFVRLFPIF